MDHAAYFLLLAAIAAVAALLLRLIDPFEQAVEHPTHDAELS